MHTNVYYFESSQPSYGTCQLIMSLIRYYGLDQKRADGVTFKALSHPNGGVDPLGNSSELLNGKGKPRPQSRDRGTGHSKP